MVGIGVSCRKVPPKSRERRIRGVHYGANGRGAKCWRCPSKSRVNGSNRSSVWFDHSTCAVFFSRLGLAMGIEAYHSLSPRSAGKSSRRKVIPGNLLAATAFFCVPNAEFSRPKLRWSCHISRLRLAKNSNRSCFLESICGMYV